MNRLIPILLIIVLIFGTTPVYAHKLQVLFPDNDIMDRALMLQLEPSRFTIEEMDNGIGHWYWFEGTQGERLKLQLLVPKIDSQTFFAPTLDLIIGNERLQFKPTIPSTEFHEEYTGTDWWVRINVDMELPDDGVYFMRVYDPSGSSGKFSLAIGEQEDFEVGDLFSFPIIKLHLYHFHERYVEILFWVFGIVFLMIIIVIGVKRRLE